MSGKKKSFLDFFKMDDVDEDYDDDDEDIFDEDDDDEDDYTPSFSLRREKKPAPEKAAPVKEESSGYTPRTTTRTERSTSQAPSASKSYSSAGASTTRRRYTATDSSPSYSSAGDKLVSFDGGQRRSSFKPSSEVYVIKPAEIDDAQTVADFLKKGRAIVINMEGLPLDPAQRIIDFIGGACYGIGGELKAISANIFIAVPNSMEVSGDLREEILTSPSLGE